MASAMKIYLISLKNALERREFQRQQLSNLGLEFELFDALTPSTSIEVATGIKSDGWERPLMPTELACFLSHYSVWQKILDSNETALILEDDVILSKNLPKFLAGVTGLEDVDHITLEVRLRKKMIASDHATLARLGVGKLLQDRTGAAAYILYPNGAEKLITTTAKNGAALADAFIANNHRIRSLQAIPALALQADVAGEYGIVTELQTISYIQLNDKKLNYVSSGLQRLRFKSRRIQGQLRLASRYIFNAMRGKRIFVEPDAAGFNRARAG
jgi:glycosyl transferase, family 25